MEDMGGKLDEKLAQFYMAEMVNGLEVIHSH